MLATSLRATAEGFMKSIVIASQTKNMRDLSAFCTDDCVRYIGPPAFLERVGVPADFRMNNREWEEQFGTMEFYILDDCNISHVVVDTDNLKVAARGELVGAFLDGKRISRTNVWFMEFTADGKKVTRVHQHTDYEESQSFRMTVAAYKKAKNEDAKIKQEMDEDSKSS